MRFLSLLCALLAPVAAMADGFTFRKPCMGTVWTIKLYTDDEKKAQEAAAAAFARVDELNGILSDYLPESELSRLSATAGTGRAVSVKGDLMTVLQLSQQAAA
jgi:thiamine biosynthesis lipoprotein